MKNKIIGFILLIPLFGSLPDFAFGRGHKKVLEISYYKNIFGNIHQSPNKYSEVITTIACGRTVKVLGARKNGWHKVQVGSYTGYVQKEFLGSERAGCFQDKYPRFFEKFKLELSDLYYWARLYDLYAQGRSRVK